MPHRETRLPSDVLAAAPVHPAKPGTSVNSLPFLVCSPPGPAGLGWRLQEPVSTQHRRQLRVPCTLTQTGGAGWALLPPDDHSLQVPGHREVMDDNSGRSPGTLLPSSPYESRKRSGAVTSSLIRASSSRSVFENSLASKPLMDLPQTRASSRFLTCPLAFLLWAHSHKPLCHKTICGNSNHK